MRLPYPKGRNSKTCNILPYCRGWQWHTDLKKKRYLYRKPSQNVSIMGIVYLPSKEPT